MQDVFCRGCGKHLLQYNDNPEVGTYSFIASVECLTCNITMNLNIELDPSKYTLDNWTNQRELDIKLYELRKHFGT